MLICWLDVLGTTEQDERWIQVWDRISYVIRGINGSTKESGQTELKSVDVNLPKVSD